MVGQNKFPQITACGNLAEDELFECEFYDNYIYVKILSFTPNDQYWNCEGQRILPLQTEGANKGMPFDNEDYKIGDNPTMTFYEESAGNIVCIVNYIMEKRTKANSTTDTEAYFETYKVNLKAPKIKLWISQLKVITNIEEESKKADKEIDSV